jgi:dinuclear metal center YbgI/SA1388 family protein
MPDTVTVSHIIDLMARIAPPSLAEDWDNCGLQVGNGSWPVQSIWVALDPSSPVVANACQKQVDLLITHHPLIFKPLRSIDCRTPIGSVIESALRHRLSIFSAHTNLDAVREGLNDRLADLIGLTRRRVLQPSETDPLLCPGGEHGIGRIGSLETPLKLKALAAELKTKLGLTVVRMAGNPDLAVREVAVCTGSGSSLMPEVMRAGVQVYISGDLRYHDARDAEAVNLGLIDIGHFASEHLMVNLLVERLRESVRIAGLRVQVESFGLEKDPFIFS